MSLEALLAQYDRLIGDPEAMRTWLAALPIDEVRPLAEALGARMFQEREEAQRAARRALAAKA